MILIAFLEFFEPKEQYRVIINAFIDLKLHIFSIALLLNDTKTHLTSCEFIRLYKQGLSLATDSNADLSNKKQ